MRFTPLAALCFLGACASPQAGAERIVLTSNVELVRGCKFLQQAGADQILTGGVLAGLGRDDAILQVKNKAVQIGGTHVITQGATTSWTGAHAVGDIYRC